MTRKSSEPRWNWTGVDVLKVKNDDARLRQLAAMFRSKRSSDEGITADLVDLCGRFQRWLHQDEFGPDRGQRTAALRALMKSIQRLDKHLIGGSSLIKGQLDAELRKQNNPSNLMVEALYEAAVDVAGDQLGAGTPDRDALWASRLRDYAFTLLTRSQSADSNTDSEIFPIAQRRRFDPLRRGPALVWRTSSGGCMVIGRSRPKHSMS
jgi:hypothetical protein